MDAERERRERLIGRFRNPCQHGGDDCLLGVGVQHPRRADGQRPA